MEGKRSWGRLGIAGKAALISAGAFTSVGLFSMGSALPRLASDFGHVSNASLLVQLVGSVVAPIFALASPLAAALVNRFGVRGIYIASIVLTAVGGAGPALCDNLAAILALRVLLAAGVAGAFTAGMSGTALLPDAQRPTVIGLISFFGGGICIPLFPLVGILAEESWRSAFLVHLIALPVILLALGLPGPSTDIAADAARSADTDQRAAGLLAGIPATSAVVAAVVGLSMVASSMYSPFFLASIGIAEPARIGQILGAMSLCSLIGSGSYGFVHRRVGTQGLLKVGLASIAAGCLIMSMSTGISAVLCGIGLLGAGLSIFVASIYASAIESVSAESSAPAAMGVITFCLYGSQMLFPLISGPVGQWAGPAAVFLLLAILVLLGLVLTVTMKRSRAVHKAASPEPNCEATS